jgi:hypothetical protein
LGCGYARLIEQLQAQLSVVFGRKIKAKYCMYEVGVPQQAR